jgi:uncharacterized protein YkwD
VLLVALAAVAGAVPAAGADSGCFRYSRAEKRFARVTNRARTRLGIEKLRLDPQLSRVAGYHTRRMARRTALYHTPDWRLARRVTRWRVLGENIGVGNTVLSLQQAFMASPAHRANVLSKTFAHFGVGTRRRSGRLWVTLVFESRRNPGTRLSMPSC